MNPLCPPDISPFKKVERIMVKFIESVFKKGERTKTPSVLSDISPFEKVERIMVKFIESVLKKVIGTL